MKRKIKIGLTFCWLMLLAAFPPAVCGERPPFKVFTTGEGLAHDSVNKIIRDSRGFLWFCTAEGLSRFDGTRFKNFTQDHGLPHRSINDLLETREGDYLVATDAGLAVFNPNGKIYRWNVVESKLERDDAEPPLFQTFVPQTGNQAKKDILSLAQDRDGKIWAGTGYGLFRIEKTSDGEWMFEEFEADEWEDKVIGFSALVADSRGGMFIAASSGAFRLSPEGEVETLGKGGASSILEDRDGRAWIGAGGVAVGLRVFERENDAWKLSNIFTQKDGLTSDSHQYAVKQTSDGRIYVAMHNSLCEFLPGTAAGEPKFRVIESGKMTALAEDAGGNLWFGTELKGAWKLANTGFTIFDAGDGVSESDDIRAIYVNKDGEISLSVRPHEILYLASGKFASVTPRDLPKRSWSWHFLDVKARDGEWWIPTEQGLLRYPKVDSFADLARTTPKKIYTTADGLPGNEIFNIFEDSREDIWFSVVGAKNALLRWERKTETFYSYTAADGLPEYNGPISFAEDSNGGVWFGFYFGGLARYRDGSFRFFTEKDGIPESLVGDLLFDSANRLWIATSGRGLFRIDDTSAKTPVFTSISTRHGLSSNQLICLVEDDFKRVYVGTGRGINRIDPNGNIRIFTQADGLPSNYVTRCAKDKNGFLWFVARNTLVKFAPERERSLPPPPVFIDKISAGGVPQKISALGETEIKTLELAADQKQIQIDFFALTFGAGENIRYQYRLDEQDWSNPTEQQTLNLDLAAGKHNFAVRAVRTDGAASENPALVSFEISPPIWARRWFIALAALLAAAIILTLYYYRTANLRRINAALTEAHRAEEELRKSREERLAELEKVRARIATDLHDDIGASLTQIAVLSEVAQTQSGRGGKNGGAASVPLTKISNVSNELVEAMSDIVWSINPAKDHLHDLTQRMRRFASDVLSAKGINFQFVAPALEDDISIGTNLRREVFLIFKESVNNIVKHSGAKKAVIEFRVADEILILSISDNGSGFAPESAAVGANGFSAADEKGGNGIMSMRRRAAEMNGSFEIVSAAGQGAKIILRLPLESAAQTGGDFGK